MPSSGPKPSFTICQRIAEQIDSQQQQRQHRQRQEQIDHAHQHIVDLAAKETGHRADHRPQADQNRHRDHADRERDPAAVQRAGQHIAPQVVGAERVLDRWASIVILKLSLAGMAV